MPQSFVKIVFVSLDYVRNLIGRAANRCDDAQGAFPRAHFLDILFPAEAWQYVKSRTSQLGLDISVDESIKKRKVSRLVTNVSISSVSFAVMEDVETLRFNTDAGLSIFQRIFGEGSVWGFRHRRPKYGERKCASRNDTLNAVFGDECYIDLLYNTTAN